MGLADGLFFTLGRNAFELWTKNERPNASKNEKSRMWQNLGVMSIIGGIISPLLYFWAAYKLGSLVEVHIFRSIISVIFSLFIGYFIFEDTINGFRLLGLSFSLLGLILILTSTAYGPGSILKL